VENDIKDDPSKLLERLGFREANRKDEQEWIET
jgi:hypothetical protein